ncbi:MAG: lipid-A-disaccharide synthase [Bdellovibrionales bacterium]|nr:lipid-A-disaccharide synthase [Bdellovibrionales bacterium]
MKKSRPDTLKVLIVAAEASSSLYAQRLLEYWKSQNQKVEAFGVGSRSMEKLGFDCIGRSEELAVVGLQEVIRHWGLIKNTFHSLIAEAEKRKPDIVLLLDYPDFNLRLAKQLKKRGFEIVYYISPQIWAWRESRVNIIQKWVDKMLVLFPFEKDFYAKHGVPVEFVGHPLLDEINDKYFDREYHDRHRAKYGILPTDVVLALMPGSRTSEMRHHLQTQIETAECLYHQYPNLKILLFVAPTFEVEEVRQMLPPLKIPLSLVKDEPFEMIDLADVVLCASGTATLMVGLLQKPMVIMYKMNRFSAWVAKRFVKSTSFFGMINLILGREVVPEMFQEQAEPELLVERLKPFIENPELRRSMSEELAKAQSRLGDRGATIRVAQALEGCLTP